jgi:hypothetical protein
MDTITPSTPIARPSSFDTDHLRALLKAFILVDLRSQHYAKATGAKANELMAPMFWVVGQCLLAGFGVAVLLFPRVDVFAFALACLLLSMLVCASAVTVEFNEIVLAPGDPQILGHYPLSPSTYAWARLINLMIYVLLITIALNIFPTILGAWLPDSGWQFVPTYAAAALIANLLAAGIVIVAFVGLTPAGPAEAVRDTLAWVQICVVVAFGYGIQAAFRDSNNRLELFALNLPEWVRLTPPGWLATAVETSTALHTEWLGLAGAFVLTAVVWGLAARSLGAAWTHMSPAGDFRGVHIEASGAPGDLGNRFERALTQPGAERVAFWLSMTMLRRDGALRMRSWPAVGSVFGLLGLGVFTGQMPDHFATGSAAAVLPVACIMLPAMSLPSLLHNFQFSSHHAAAWLLETSAEGTRHAAMREGVRKAVMWGLVLPVLVALFAAFWLVWRQPVHAAVHVIAGWLIADLTSRVVVRSAVTAPPFSLPLAKGESLGKIGLVSAGASVFVASLGGVYALTSQSPWMLAVLLGTMLAVSMSASFSASRGASRGASGQTGSLA